MAQEAYCNMLVKYREELTRPIDEAMEFLKRVEAQLESIAGAAVGGSSAARLSLAGNEKKNSCRNSFFVLSYMVVRRPHVFFITICAIGLPHWEWLFWIAGLNALDHCHCELAWPASPNLPLFSVDYFNP
jgi:hypothetical protein